MSSLTFSEEVLVDAIGRRRSKSYTSFTYQVRYACKRESMEAEGNADIFNITSCYLFP